MRAMAPEDLPGVLKIERACFKAPWTRGMFEETLGSPVARSLVIEAVSGILGYIVFYFAAPEMHIMNIAAHPDLRRRGIAQAMMSFVLDFARESSIEECFLEVRESNGSARGLYEKLGFEVVGRRKGYYKETGEDALVMRLSL